MVTKISLNQQIEFIYNDGNAFNVMNALLKQQEPHPEADDANSTFIPASMQLITYEKAGHALITAENEGGVFFVKRHAMDTPEQYMADMARERARQTQAQEEQTNDPPPEAYPMPDGIPRQTSREPPKTQARTGQAPNIDEAKAKRAQQQARKEAQASAERAKMAAAKARKEQADKKLRKEKFLSKCQSVFERTDHNQDGLLTRAEIIRALRHDLELPMLLELPTHIAANTPDHSQRLFEEVFQHMDIDEDRHISAEEFQRFCMHLHPDYALGGPDILTRTQTM